MFGNFILYIIFILLALGTGAVFWVIRKYSVPGVISLVLALFAPLLTLLVTAQRNTKIEPYPYILEEMSAGNTWARFVVIIHVYLIGWLLFLLVRGVIYLIQSPIVREKINKLMNKLTTKKPPTIKEKAE